MKKLLYIVTFVLIANTTFAKISKIERKVLIDLSNSTNGSKWTKKWDLSTPVSEWFGVEIENGSVVSIILLNNNLNGELPSSIGNLKNIRVLNLAFNSLEGDLPQTIVRLKSLIVLRLGKNNLTGRLPENIDDMQRLEILDLFSNRISGKLPKSLGYLRNLKVVSLSDNAIEGVIPLEIGKLGSLERLELADNELHGGVPKEISGLTKLYSLVLSKNKLTGEFPEAVLSLANLRIVQIQYNDFDKKYLTNNIPEKTNLVLFEFDDIQNRIDRKDLDNFFSDRDIRTADTKFEDDNDN